MALRERLLLSGTLLISLFVCSRADEISPLVESPVGSIRGRDYVIEDVQVEAFLGIPYAKPPVGDLRFALPVAFGKVGEFEATNFSARCPQPEIVFESPTPSSEDCLYLNVFRKDGTKDGDNKPVVVIFHGGAFSTGASSDFFYAGQPLAGLGDLVVVTFNYRLGVLGFGDMMDVAPGNLGLYDQRLVLEWVQDNIKSFGGNPERVTLMGMSAGSMSVSAQVETPLNREGRKLFHAAIMDGGVLARSLVDTPEASLVRMQTIAKNVGCKLDDMLLCLRQVMPDELVKLSYDIEGHSPIFTFRPTLDDKFISKEFIEGAHDSATDTGRVKTLIGYAKDEGTWFSGYYENLSGTNFPDMTTDTEFVDWCGKLASGYKLPIDVKEDEPKKNVLAAYYEKHASRYLDASAFVGDGFFVCPVNAYLKSHAKIASNVFAYRFDRKLRQTYMGLDPETTGAFHISPYIHMTGCFLSLKDFVPDAPEVHADDKAFFLDGIQLVASFARSDDPPKFRELKLPDFNKGGDMMVFDDKPLIEERLFGEDRCKKVFPSFESHS